MTELAVDQQAQLREAVAHAEGIEPDDITGTTENEMRASAQAFKTRFEAAVTNAIAAAGPQLPPAAAPASVVTSSTPIPGRVPIRSRADLANMPPGEIAAAHRDGRLDDLIAGR